MYMLNTGVVLLFVPNNTSLCRRRWTIHSCRKSWRFNQHVI